MSYALLTMIGLKPLSKFSYNITNGWIEAFNRQDVTTAFVQYYLFEAEVKFHEYVHLVSEDIGEVG